jgi:hypothetical protein
LFGHGTWTLVLRKEDILKVFENRILRNVFGSKERSEGGPERLDNEELHNLFPSQNIIRFIT